MSDRGELAETQTFGHGGIKFTTYPASGRVAVEVAATNAVMDLTELFNFVDRIRKPRTIATVGELDALPYGSAVLTSDISDTVVLRSDREDFVNQSGCTIDARTLWDYGSKPFTVLWEPLP